MYILILKLMVAASMQIIKNDGKYETTRQERGDSNRERETDGRLLFFKCVTDIKNKIKNIFHKDELSYQDELEWPRHLRCISGNILPTFFLPIILPSNFLSWPSENNLLWFFRCSSWTSEKIFCGWSFSRFHCFPSKTWWAATWNGLPVPWLLQVI